MVNSLQSLDELRTFGWSLSGGVDVDNNQYSGKEGRQGGRENLNQCQVGLILP